MSSITFESATVFYNQSDVSQGADIPAKLTAANGAGINKAEITEFQIEMPSQLLDENYVQNALQDGRSPQRKKLNLMDLSDSNRQDFMSRIDVKN